MAAARGLYEGAVYITVLLEQIVARHRQPCHRMQPIGLVDPAHRALLEIAEQLADYKLGLANYHGIAMP